MKYLKVKLVIGSVFFITGIITSNAQEKNMNIKNEYSTLKKVMVGNSTNLIVPNELPPDLEGEKISFFDKLFFKLYKGKTAPKWLTRKLEIEQNEFIDVLKKYNVEIIRPNVVQPQPNEVVGLAQMYVRDPAFIIGDKLFFGNLFSPERRKEIRGFNNIIETTNPANISSLQNSVAYKNAFIEGGDVIVDYPYVFVGVSSIATNLDGINWLKAQLRNEYKVVPLEFADKTILHLDCIMTIIGNKKGIIHKNSLKLPLPYPLTEYDFIEVDSKTRKSLGTNVFVINEKTVVVQKKHTQLKAELLKKGFNVETVNFDRHSDLGGAFRCVTFPIERAE